MVSKKPKGEQTAGQPGPGATQGIIGESGGQGRGRGHFATDMDGWGRAWEGVGGTEGSSIFSAARACSWLDPQIMPIPIPNSFLVVASTRYLGPRSVWGGHEDYQYRRSCDSIAMRETTRLFALFVFWGLFSPSQFSPSQPCPPIIPYGLMVRGCSSYYCEHSPRPPRAVVTVIPARSRGWSPAVACRCVTRRHRPLTETQTPTRVWTSGVPMTAWPKADSAETIPTLVEV